MTQSLQAQIAWCSKVRWALVCAVVAFLMGFYAVAYRPATQRLADLRLESASRSRELGSNQVRTRQLPAIVEEVEKLRTRVERFDKKLPQQQELGQFIKDITQVSQQASLHSVGVQPGVPRRTDLFNELPISMSFEGDFQTGVFTFLRQTEQMQRLTRVRKLDVHCIDPKTGQVQVQVSMNIYFKEG